MHIVWVIIIGFVAGIVARLLAPGPNNPAGFILTTLVGIAGAFVATFIGQAIGWYGPDQGAGLIGAVYRRAGRLIHLAPTGVGARYPRPRRQTLALGWTGARRGDLRSTTTARATPPRPGIVSRLSGRRIFRTARLASSAGTDINATTISIWPARSSVRPCAAKTASSSVGGSRRTRRKPSFVSHTSLNVAPCAPSCCAVALSPIIISHLPRCSKYIVQRTHGIVNAVSGYWFMTRRQFA